MSTNLLTLLTLGLLAAGAAHAAPTWITIGERARALLQPLAPDARALSSTPVSVMVPLQRGSRQLQRGTETVYAVELDDAALPALSQAVHSQLHRCGGFMRHASMAEALAVLNRAGKVVSAPTTVRYVIDNQAVVQPMINQPQASNILATIQGLSDFQNRYFNSSHGVAASDWLYAKWQSMRPLFRRDVQVRQITHGGWPQKSVVMDFLGTGNSAEVIVIGGHLDSIMSWGPDPEGTRAPGADDDASGIASITEVIRVLVANNYTPKRTIRFIGYAAEEAGLWGSREIATAAGADRARVVGVLQLDMTAYQGDSADLWVISDYTDPAQNQFIADLAAAYLPELNVAYDVCGYACSDHASWSTRGYVASFPFESSMGHHSPYIHTEYDTIANFGGTANHALKFSRLALAYALELGSDGP